MSESGNVVYLAYRSPAAEDDMMAFIACKHCKNKTYTLTYDQPEPSFPLLRCAACGQHMGRMGWAPHD